MDGVQAFLLNMKQDKRHRKIYLTTNRGDLKVYNVSSGVLLANIDTNAQIKKTYEQKKIEKKDEESVSSDDPLTDSEEGEPDAITDMQLIWNDHMYHILTVDRE